MKRESPRAPGDLLLSFVKLQMRGGQPLFAMVKALVKLPAESQSFMQFLLSKAAVHLRLRGGGISVVNLANLVGYAVYPGVAQIPADAWLAEPISEGMQSIGRSIYENQTHSNTQYLPQPARSEIIEVLNLQLADAIDLGLKAKQAHFQ